MKKTTIQHRFEKFDEAYPEIYELFCTFVGLLLSSGKTHYSADAILHRIRWEYDVNPEHDFDGFKINDHFSSRYARKWQEQYPDAHGFFETRKLRVQ